MSETKNKSASPRSSDLTMEEESVYPILVSLVDNANVITLLLFNLTFCDIFIVSFALKII